MGSSSSNDKGAALNDDIDRINRDRVKQQQEAPIFVPNGTIQEQRVFDAETITLAIKGPHGKVDVNARLNGTIQELTEQVAANLGVTKPSSKYVTLHFCGYQLQPVTKTVREFTELCEGSEIDPEGISKAMKEMAQAERQRQQEEAERKHKEEEAELIWVRMQRLRYLGPVRTDADLHKAVKAWLSNPVESQAIYGHISDWDVSRVTNMSYIFTGADNFNQDISRWDVGQVTNMYCMFSGASSFNQNLSKWNVSRVTNHRHIFPYTFNEALEPAWKGK